MSKQPKMQIYAHDYWFKILKTTENGKEIHKKCVALVDFFFLTLVLNTLGGTVLVSNGQMVGSGSGDGSIDDVVAFFFELQHL